MIDFLRALSVIVLIYSVIMAFVFGLWILGVGR